MRGFPAGFRFSFLIAVFAAAPLLADWQFLPAGSPVVNTIIASSSGERVLCSVYGGGVWLSSDFAQTWTGINEQFNAGRPYIALWLIAADADLDTAIADFSAPGSSTTNRYTTDGGATWQEFVDENAASASNMFVFPARPNVWLCTTPDHRMYRSSAGAHFWSPVANPPDFEFKFFSGIGSDSTVWAAQTWEENFSLGSISRSTDWGITWQHVAQLNEVVDCDNIYIEILAPISNGDILVTAYAYSGYPSGANGRLALRYRHDTSEWEAVEGLPERIWPEEVLEDRDQPGTVLMTGSLIGGMARSTDYGYTWQWGLAGLPQGRSIGFELSQNPFGGGISAVYNDGVYRSTDHGVTWTMLNLPPIAGGGEIFALPEAVIQYSGGEDHARQYLLESPFTAWRDIAIQPYSADTSFLMSKVLFRQGLQLVSTVTGFIPMDSGNWSGTTYMLRSHDDGLTWQRDNEIEFDVNIECLNSRSSGAETRIIGAEARMPVTLYQSTDLGATWEYFWTLPDQYWADQIIQTEHTINVLCSVSDSYREYVLFRTTNGGVVWHQIPFTRNDPYPTVLTFGDNVVVIADSSFLLRGETLEYRGLAPDDSVFHWFWTVAAIEGNSPRFVACLDQTTALWLSEDTLRTWQRREIAVPYPEQMAGIYSLTYDPYRERLWAGTSIGACYLDIAELGVTDRPLEFKPADYTLLSAYPNPFNDQARVRFDLMKSERVTIDLYSIEGRKVRTLTDDIRTAGRHELALDARDLASGVYFVRLETASVKRTEKMVLLR